MFGMWPGSKEEHVLLTSHGGTHERTWWTRTTGPQSRRRVGPRTAGLETHRTHTHTHRRVAKIDSQCHCGTPRTSLVHQRPPGWVVWWWTGLKTLKRFCTMACCIPARFPWWIPPHHEGKGQNVAARPLPRDRSEVQLHVSEPTRRTQRTHLKPSYDCTLSQLETAF